MLLVALINEIIRLTGYPVQPESAGHARTYFDSQDWRGGFVMVIINNDNSRKITSLLLLLSRSRNLCVPWLALKESVIGVAILVKILR